MLFPAYPKAAGSSMPNTPPCIFFKGSIYAEQAPCYKDKSKAQKASPQNSMTEQAALFSSEIILNRSKPPEQ